MAPQRKLDQKLMQKRTSPRFQVATTTDDSLAARTEVLNCDSSENGDEDRKRHGTLIAKADCKEKRIKLTPSLLEQQKVKLPFDGNNCRTPDLPAGFFVSSSRLKYSPRSEDMQSLSPEDQAQLSTSDSVKENDQIARNVGPPVSANIQRVLREYTFFNRTKKRAAVAGHEQPMKRAAVAGEHPPMKHGAFEKGLSQSQCRAVSSDSTSMKCPVVEGVLPSKKPTHHMNSADPNGSTKDNHPPKPQRVPVTEKSGQTEQNNGKENVDWIRDPLLHMSVVTPPCPILPGQDQTPKEERTYTHRPDIPLYLIPTVGMRFSKVEDAHEFYNRYAKHAGFGTKKGQKNGNNVYLQCTREGVHKSQVLEEDRRRLNTTKRCNCRARLRLKKRKEDDCYVIEDINFEHNHRLFLSPSMLVFLHSHKTFDPELLAYVKFLQFHNIKHTQIMQIIAGSLGGEEFMPLHSRDLLNEKAKNTREDNVEDVQKLFSFFYEMKAANEEFFFDFQIDDSLKIKNIFWANASCRGAYEDFGDCITFDTTYKTNQYKMPLGVFVGVNNHLQSTIFACALVRDESEDSFEWLFRTFLKCMNGKQPTIILTDQCPAMAGAIPRVFVCALHKLCRWHITKKYKDPLKVLYKLYINFKSEFTAILNWPLMPTEFEQAWHQLVEKYNLHEHTMIIQMWEDRKEWISAYFKEAFCARMTSTQRSESMNAILKRGYVGKDKNLHRFVDQVNKCIQNRRRKEQEQTIASEAIPDTRTHYGFEEQFGRVYTKAVYSEFRTQLKKSTLFSITESTEKKAYYLVQYKNPQKVFSWSHHQFKVEADEVKGKYKCECMLWEHTGLFCLHIIACLEHLRVDRVPEKYLLNRYSKGAARKATFDRKDYRTTSSDGTSVVYQHQEVLQLAFKVVRKSSRSEEQRARAKQGLIDLIEELDAMGNSTTGDEEPEEELDISKYEPDVSELNTIDTSVRFILPPPISKTKGSGTHEKENKKKNKHDPKELPTEIDEDGNPVIGKRTCGTCGNKGHNARTCTANTLQSDEVPPTKRIKRRICKTCNKMAGHNTLKCPIMLKAMQYAKKKLLLQANMKRRRRVAETDEEEEEGDDDEQEENEEESEEEGEGGTDHESNDERDSNDEEEEDEDLKEQSSEEDEQRTQQPVKKKATIRKQKSKAPPASAHLKKDKRGKSINNKGKSDAKTDKQEPVRRSSRRVP